MSDKVPPNWRELADEYQRSRLVGLADVPFIDARLKAQLDSVEPSRESDFSFEYRPCKVKLVTGQWRDHVYIVEAMSYIKLWGDWPWEDAGTYLPLDDVVEIESSPTRLPATLASKIYAAVESGMGYCVFTLITTDGHQIPCLTGNAVDWVDLPVGVAPEDIADVLPHQGVYPWEEGSQTRSIQASPYVWCLYRLTE